MRRHFIRASVAIAAILAAMPGAAAGQTAGQFIFTPYVGAYVPSSDLGSFRDRIDGTPLTAKLKHENAFAFGVNASYWMNSRMAIELGTAYAMTDLTGTVRGNFPVGDVSIVGTRDAHVILGSAKAMLNVFPAESKTRIRLGFGPAIISRGGKAFNSNSEEKTTGLTNFGGAISLCTRLPITNVLGIRLRAENYMYQSQLKYRNSLDPSQNFNLPKKFQNDFMLTAGLQIGLMP